MQGETISTSVSAAQPIAMGRFHFPLLLLALLSSVSAQRTSQGFQQQFRGPRLRQQSQTRSVGSQQPGRFRVARGRQPTIVSAEQALADSFNFNIPFRTPADIVRAPGRFARALWDIEVGQYAKLCFYTKVMSHDSVSITVHEIISLYKPQNMVLI